MLRRRDQWRMQPDVGIQKMNILNPMKQEYRSIRMGVKKCVEYAWRYAHR